MRNIKRKFFLVLVFACITILGTFSPRSCFSLSKDEYLVKKVIDGDTIKLANGRSVRYIGVNTTETRRKSGGRWVYSPEPFAREAKEYNKSLISRGRVKLEFDGQKEDRYGRMLAYVYSKGKMINEELLREGLAILSIYPGNTQYVKRFSSAQEYAIRNNKGLWKECRQIPAKDARFHIGEVHKIAGKVYSVNKTKRSVFINFSGNRSGFTGIIPIANLEFFKEKKINPFKYKNRYVEITGKIRSGNMGKIIIFHPSQIKVLKHAV